MQARGIFLTVLSAVLYGLNPLFSKTINVGGCNSLTQTFARLAAGIVIFFILLVCSGSGSVREKLRLSRRELKDILICCIGYGLIGPLLFASYNYLASGLATTLHFVYPVLVVVACIAFRYERATRRKLVCCALCFAGILCFYTPGGDVSAYGVFLALASGVAWAYYIVHLNSSGLVTMAPFKLAFWLCVFSAVLVGGITLAMGEFVWPSTAFTRGALALYCCVSTAASLLFQLGNRFIGAQSASMLSTFEPLTSVVIGILVYHEVLTVRLGIGIFCILLAVFLLVDRNFRPLGFSLAEARSAAMATRALNAALTEALEDGVDYDDLMNVRMDDGGQVSLLSANTMRMNALAERAGDAALRKLETVSAQKVDVPLGAALGLTLLAGSGPRIPISIVPVGSVQTDFETEFEACGINQTRHKVYLQLSASIRIVIPTGAKTTNVTANMLVAESIIVGKVPESFVGYRLSEEELNMAP